MATSGELRDPCSRRRRGSRGRRSRSTCTRSALAPWPPVTQILNAANLTVPSQ